MEAGKVTLVEDIRECLNDDWRTTREIAASMDPRYEKDWTDTSRISHYLSCLEADGYCESKVVPGAGRRGTTTRMWRLVQ